MKHIKDRPADSRERGRVISRIAGGLGNQLFMYATARAFAERSKRALYLDTISGYKSDKYGRQYSLDAFKIKAGHASRLESFDVPGGGVLRAVRRVVNRRLPLRRRGYLLESDLPQERLEGIAAARTAYLDGYWQRHAYFESLAGELRAEIKLVKQLDQRTVDLGRSLSSQCSVAIHFRGMHGVTANGVRIASGARLTESYYRRAIELAVSKLSSPRFYVFTDGD